MATRRLLPTSRPSQANRANDAQLDPAQALRVVLDRTVARYRRNFMAGYCQGPAFATFSLIALTSNASI